MKQLYSMAAPLRYPRILRARTALLVLLMALPGLALAQTITSFSPASGPVGTSVTLTGTGFNATASQNVIFFGATRASVTAASATSQTVTVPAGSTYSIPSSRTWAAPAPPTPPSPSS